MFDQAGLGVVHLQAFYRRDRYYLRMVLARTSARGEPEWSPTGGIVWPNQPRKKKPKSTRRVPQ